MQTGLLTAPYTKEPLENAIRFAGEAGFDAVEIAVTPGGTHFDPLRIDDAAAEALHSLLTRNHVSISGLAYYANVTHPDQAEREKIIGNLRATIDAAAKLNVGIVCAMAGHPLPGKTRMQTIEEEVPGVLGPVVKYAGEKGIKIALENWTATNIMNLAQWQRIFELIPDDNFGLNFDPSHLIWQGIDYLEAVDRFAPRIFHTHAKDTEIKDEKLRWLGNQERGWWRYCIPGFGRVQWGEYFARLYQIGYTGVVSIEHEDAALGREEGFRKGLQYLKLFI